MRIIFIFLLLFNITSSLSGQKDTSTIINPEFYNKYSLKETDVNTNRSEFSPFLFQDKLYFVSNRKITFGVIFKGDDFTDVYTTAKTDSIHFKETKLFQLVNSVTNDGPVSIDKSGSCLYFSTNEKKYDYLIKTVEIEKKLKIYYCTFENDKWSSPKILPVCTEDYSYLHPAISPDNKTLYFASDMPGGYGGMDLYSSTFQNNEWSKPINLGPEINTADDEIFPFVNASDNLFFSSKRKSGLGGLDIYIARKNENGKLYVQIAPRDLNSKFDDFGIWTDSTFEKGYVSTNRDNENDGIYYFEKTIPDFDDCLTMKHNLCYSFFEESTLEAEDTLGMTYEWSFGDGTKERGIKVKHCFPNSGSYVVELNIVEKSSGHLFYNELSYDFTTVDPDQLYIACRDTVRSNESFLVDASKSKMDGFTILKYYWIFSDSSFNIGMRAMHQYASNGSYIVKLGVLVQNDSTNQLQTFCTEKTVYVGSGNWLAANDTTKASYEVPTVRDSLFYVKDGNDVSFKVNLGTSEKQLSKTSYVFSGMDKIEEHKEKGYYRYTTGNEENISEIISYYRAARAKGFKDAVVISYYRDTLIAGQENSLKGTITDTSTVGPYNVMIHFDNSKEANDLKAKLFKSDTTTKNAFVNIPYDQIKKSLPDLLIDSTYNHSPLDIQWFIKKSLRDTAVYYKFLTAAGNYYDKEIIYTVQIGAYRHPENFKYPQLAIYGAAVIKAYPDGITRFTMKRFKSISEAEEFRQQCIRKGISDAWITAEYRGERYTLEQLIENYFFTKKS